MAKSMRERFEGSKRRVRESDSISEEERERIIDFLKANDNNYSTHSMPDGKTKTASTLSRYATNLRIAAKDLDIDLTEATANDINQLMDAYRNGEIGQKKSDGTVRNYQGPLRRFYLYHDDLGVDRDDIAMSEKPEPQVDERDMFTKEEVHALREEAEKRGTRDIALLDLLIYTGQRRSAILNLRLKDIDVENGTFRLNENDGDLKGAAGKRPLLGAKSNVRDWMRQHPTGKRDDYFITLKYERKNMESGKKLDPSTVYRQLKRIGEGAGVDKPVNAHNFRHYFVTVCKRDYRMDNDTIRHLIGHAPDSRVMETTYSHLTDEDYIEAAEVAAGFAEPEDERPLTPPVCSRCGKTLDGDFDVCPYCGHVYSPTIQEKKKEVNTQMWKDRGDVESGSKEEISLDEVRRFINNNPELLDNNE